MIEIIAFSRDYVIAELGISQATLYRYLSFLKQSLGDDFPYEFGSKSVPSECFEILKIFRELTRKFNVKYAAKNIKKELIENGYIIQESQKQPTGKSTGKSTRFTIEFPR